MAVTPGGSPSPTAAVWLEAARPRTLVAAAVPVVVGTAAADTFIAWRFAAALLVALSLQVAVNYANDYFDAVGGVDRPDRVGPRRVTASGLATPGQMRLAIALALAAALAGGLSLVLAVGPELLVVGVASVLAALGYSGGPRPYASLGLGEVFVFLFFGVVPTVGSAYVQRPDVGALLTPLAASIPVGLMAVLLLLVNNVRDLETDAAAGKRTLAVRLGPRRTRLMFVTVTAVALVATGPVALVTASAWPLLALLAAPLASQLAEIVAARHGRDLLPALPAAARLIAVYGSLLTAGLAASRIDPMTVLLGVRPG